MMVVVFRLLSADTCCYSPLSQIQTWLPDFSAGVFSLITNEPNVVHVNHTDWQVTHALDSLGDFTFWDTRAAWTHRGNQNHFILFTWQQIMLHLTLILHFAMSSSLTGSESWSKDILILLIFHEKQVILNVKTCKCHFPLSHQCKSLNSWLN